ncbi:DUF3052 domain-containing protein [Streptomyces griseoluteus]|uniref:DUF3052 domain-containing protein n=1 Tax=Streptomyces griseoluteus TaxID=29306 RepID=UPI0036FF612B
MVSDQGTERTNRAARVGLVPGQVVQEIGYGEDVDHDLRDAIEELTGNDLVGDDYADVADVVLLWFRDDDGDLTDALVQAVGLLDEGGMIWLLTPKESRDGHVKPSEIAEAAQTAGLSQSKSAGAATDWTGTRLAAPRR